MSMPDKCIWCGLHDIRNTEGEVHFACGSSCYDISGVWEQSTGCAEILKLRKRVAVAIKATQQANRFDLVSWRNRSIDAYPDSTGCYAWAGVLDDIREILQGNSPEIPEGSP